MTGPKRDDLLENVVSNPTDGQIRSVYADWLEEHGHAEEARLQREIVAADMPVDGPCYDPVLLFSEFDRMRRAAPNRLALQYPSPTLSLECCDESAPAGHETFPKTWPAWELDAAADYREISRRIRAGEVARELHRVAEATREGDAGKFAEAYGAVARWLRGLPRRPDGAEGTTLPGFLVALRHRVEAWMTDGDLERLAAEAAAQAAEAGTAHSFVLFILDDMRETLRYEGVDDLAEGERPDDVDAGAEAVLHDGKDALPARVAEVRAAGWKILVDCQGRRDWFVYDTDRYRPERGPSRQRVVVLPRGRSATA